MRPASAVSCDIFCAVIDNLGDAGVCWRLARQLTEEQGWAVRLWIDDPAPIAALAPEHAGLPAGLPIEVLCWAGDFAAVKPARVVIEAFGCTLPARYVAAMAAMPRQPVWLNLEYLSAEDWVAGCHGLPSPQAGLQKYFFFPGFAPGTGGLLRERDYAVPMLAANPADAVPPEPTFGASLEVSLFCYANAQLPALLDCWRDGAQHIVCHVADGLPRMQVADWLGAPFATGATMATGRLRLAALPFLPQVEYDRLLDRCHLNFVRGEDSFVRAQWAARPFVWQAYPQAEAAHLAKLTAFLARYAPGPTAAAFFRAWNGDGALDWPAFAAALPTLAARAPGWARQIAAQGDLATNLAHFCAARL